MFFSKLAWTGIKKNSKLYVPYIVSCVGMVMMSYIMQSLRYSPSLNEMRGGDALSSVLGFGRFVIAIFAMLFLFYTNSFLMRRRYKEFGLYGILGMGKASIAGILLCETALTAAISVVGGMGFGILFSKLAELCLIKMVGGSVDYKITVSPKAIWLTLSFFAVIFVLLFLRSLWQVRKARPLELLRSEVLGEKKPKANWVFSAIGIILLGTAYYFSVTIKSALTATLLFFVAVIAVIIATYILFMSGSVTLCTLLKKNKRYYYKKNHFVSVSSMTYRMKRNGAGLASICILSTMVLVTVSTTASLYFGRENMLKARYPMENEISVYFDSTEKLADGKSEVYENYDKILANYSKMPLKETKYTYMSMAGFLTKNEIEPDVNNVRYSAITLDKIYNIYFMEQDEYNLVTNKSFSLEKGQAMLYCMRCTYNYGNLKIGGLELEIVGKLDSYASISNANAEIMPALMLVIHDISELEPLGSLVDFNGNTMLESVCYYGYNIEADHDTTIELFNDMCDSIKNVSEAADEKGAVNTYRCCVENERYGFLSVFGGLFFLGTILSILFMLVTVMIIYYKQISEGYEDQARFAVMQKIGMMKKDIKKSINSQILTVFFAPLLFAGVHLAFAFPMLWKILQLFSLQNLGFVIAVTAIAFAVFGLLYAIVYKITAGAYYKIVSGTD